LSLIHSPIWAIHEVHQSEDLVFPTKHELTKVIIILCFLITLWSTYNTIIDSKGLPTRMLSRLGLPIYILKSYLPTHGLFTYILMGYLLTYLSTYQLMGYVPIYLFVIYLLMGYLPTHPRVTYILPYILSFQPTYIG
jgi:hypothetical protein